MRTPVTRRPGTSAASAAFAAGTTAAVTPGPRRRRDRGQHAPHRPHPAVQPELAEQHGVVEHVRGHHLLRGQDRCGDARSKLEPRLGRLAGDRLTVTRLVAGQCWPLLTIAARTRSRDSASDASGRPTRLYDGTPTPRSASTSTR